MRKLLILIFVTGVILDESDPPCVEECIRTHMKDLEEASLAEICRAVQNLLDCVKERCNDPDISRRMYDRIISGKINKKCDSLRY